MTPEKVGGDFSPFFCACFTLNYIVGTGFLALPWAFYQGGWLLSSMAMVLVCGIANLGCDYLLSAMARAEHLMSQNLQKKSDDSSGLTIDTKDEGEISLLDAALRPALTVDYANEGASLLGDDCSEKLLLKERCIEVPDLCKLFLGNLGFKCYALCVSLYCYGALWSFTAVFGNAVALVAPNSSDPYAFSVLLYAIIVIPMSFLELSEQKIVQVTLSAGRIFMIVLMIFTPLIATIFCHSNAQSSCTSHFSQQTMPNGAPLVNFSGFHRMMPIMVYAAIVHFSIPSLTQEVSQKSQLGNIFAMTSVLCAFLYTYIGTIDAWYFGGDVQQSVNLNWADYHGGTGEIFSDADGQKLTWIHVAWWARMLSFFILIFPAINVVSTFPLYALSLGNDLMRIYYGDNVCLVEKNRRITSLFRAIAAIPPLIGGLFVRDLGTIAGYTGLSGLAIAFCFPALLYIRSTQKLKYMGIPYTTHYERLGSSIFAAGVVLIFGLVLIIGVFITLIH